MPVRHGLIFQCAIWGISAHLNQRSQPSVGFCPTMKPGGGQAVDGRILRQGLNSSAARPSRDSPSDALDYPRSRPGGRPHSSDAARRPFVCSPSSRRAGRHAPGRQKPELTGTGPPAGSGRRGRRRLNQVLIDRACGYGGGVATATARRRPIAGPTAGRRGASPSTAPAACGPPPRSPACAGPLPPADPGHQPTVRLQARPAAGGRAPSGRPRRGVRRGPRRGADAARRARRGARRADPLRPDARVAGEQHRLPPARPRRPGVPRRGARVLRRPARAGRRAAGRGGGGRRARRRRPGGARWHRDHHVQRSPDHMGGAARGDAGGLDARAARQRAGALRRNASPPGRACTPRARCASSASTSYAQASINIVSAPPSPSASPRSPGR